MTENFITRIVVNKSKQQFSKAYDLINVRKKDIEWRLNDGKIHLKEYIIEDV